MVDGVAQEQIFAINYTIGDLDPTYLFGLTDLLDATTLQSGEAFAAGDCTGGFQFQGCLVCAYLRCTRTGFAGAVLCGLRRSGGGASQARLS
jgi:hypothetical protein